MSEVASVGKAYQLYKNRAIKTKYQLHFEEAKRWAGVGSPVARNRLLTKHQMFSPSYDVIFPGQFRQYDGAFVEGQEISTDCLGVYLVGDYRKKISTFILPQFSGKTAGLEAVARTEPYLKKKKIYYAVSFNYVADLDEFLQKKSRECYNFTVVKVMTTITSKYTFIYYVEE